MVPEGRHDRFGVERPSETFCRLRQGDRGLIRNPPDFVLAVSPALAIIAPLFVERIGEICVSASQTLVGQPVKGASENDWTNRRTIGEFAQPWWPDRLPDELRLE
jgi:hypothetical protein